MRQLGAAQLAQYLWADRLHPWKRVSKRKKKWNFSSCIAGTLSSGSGHRSKIRRYTQLGRQRVKVEKNSRILVQEHNWCTQTYRYSSIIIPNITCMACNAATMAGLPKPWEMSEKWVNGFCIIGSSSGGGLVLQSGDRSLFNSVINSEVICL